MRTCCKNECEPLISVVLVEKSSESEFVMFAYCNFKDWLFVYNGGY